MDGGVPISFSLSAGDNNVLSIPISKANLDKTFMKIRFQLIDPVRPKDFGPNKDGRLLGIGLISAQFE